MKNINVTILSMDSECIPVAVQSTVRNRFAFSKKKEVFVKYCLEDEAYDVFQEDKFICSFDELGNEL